MKNKFIHLFLSFLFIFNSIFATEGVNIYSIKDGKALILLGKEKGRGWTDFTGGVDKKGKDNPDGKLNTDNKFKNGPRKGQNITKFNMGAAREAHEESMGVFLFPDKNDPEPEKHVEEGRTFFLKKFEEESSFYVSAIPIQKPGQKFYQHSSWFVKVDYVPEEHLKEVWTKLYARYEAKTIAHDYIEKEDWKWFDVNDFIGEQLKSTPSLSSVFVQAMSDVKVQRILINLRSQAEKTKPQPQPIAQTELKPVDVLTPGTYVVKNKIDKTFGGTGGTNNPLAWLYSPSEIKEKNEIGENFDAVLINKEKEAGDEFKFEIKIDSVIRNFNYIELDPNPVILSRGVFVWKCDFASETHKYLYRRIGMLSLFVEDQAEGKVAVFNEYTLRDAKAVYNMQSFIKTGKQYDASKYPEHPFNFKVKKIVGDKEEGPEYLVNFNKQKPEIISVIGVVDPRPAPQPQPQAQLQLQGKLEQLKINLAILKNKLGSLGEKLEDLKGKLGRVKSGGVANPLVTKDIVIDGKKYCTCEFWNLPLLEAKVKSMCDVKVGSNPGFNVIFAQNLNVADFMKKPENNGAVFQIAANDDLVYTWISGGVQAGAVVNATELGIEARKKFINKDGEDQFNAFFKDNGLSLNSKGHVSLGTLENFAGDLTKILIALHSDLKVQGVPGQTVQVPFVAAYSSGDTSPQNTNCLKVAYDGTLLAAVKLNAQKVFLTFMGGKVFASSKPPEKIIGAIKNAVTTYVQKYGLNVTLFYPITGVTPDPAKAGPLMEIVKSVGGYVEISGVRTSYKKSV